MQIIKFEPQAGDWFDSFIEKAIEFATACTNYLFVPLNPQNMWNLENNAKTEYRTGAHWDTFKSTQYTKLDLWANHNPIQNDFIVEFCFNSEEPFQIVVENRVVKTTVEDLKAEYQLRIDNKKKEHEKWLLTPEGIEYTRQLEEEEASSKAKIANWKAKLETYTLEFAEEGEQKWNQGLEVNQDGYGRGVYDYAKTWAYLMQQQMVDGILTKEIMDSTSNEADVEGITGFMHGAAVSILAQCWKYGNQLRKIHNNDYGVDSETSTVNPAMITITN